MSCLKQEDAKLGKVKDSAPPKLCGADVAETPLLRPGKLREGHIQELKYKLEWRNRYEGDAEKNS